MARIRTVKPETFSSYSLAQVSIEARYLFIGLWTEADDEGRLIDSPKRIAGDLFPHDEGIDEVNVTAWIDDLARVGSVVRYRSGRGRYLMLPGWPNHQKISHPTPSKLPSCESPEPAPEHNGKAPETFRPEQGTGNREQGKGTGKRELGAGANAPPPLAPKKERTPDYLFEAVCEVTNITLSELTPALRGPLNRAVAELRGVRAEVSEVHRRARKWKHDRPDIALTPNGLAKNWAMLGEVPRKPRTNGSGPEVYYDGKGNEIDAPK